MLWIFLTWIWLFINRELYTMMNKVANVLKSHGVVKGDRVAIYIPVSPIAVASMLACARIGAIHSVVFAGFSAQALASRIIDGIKFSLHSQSLGRVKVELNWI